MRDCDCKSRSDIEVQACSSQLIACIRRRILILFVKEFSYLEVNLLLAA